MSVLEHGSLLVTNIEPNGEIESNDANVGNLNPQLRPNLVCGYERRNGFSGCVVLLQQTGESDNKRNLHRIGKVSPNLVHVPAEAQPGGPCGAM